MSPLTNWGPRADAGASGSEAPVTIFLTGEVGSQRLLAWQQAVTMDGRFRMAAVANDPSDFQNKLAYNPEVVVLDALIFPGPQPLIQAVTSVTGAAFVILPSSVSTASEPEIQELPEKLKTIPSVKGVYIGDAPIPDLLQRAYEIALTLRRTIAAPKSWQSRSGGMATAGGMRVITVWNRAGGVGKTTISAALSQAVARKGMRSLLIGLDAPDVMPLHLNLKQEPNILGWFTNPTDDGLKKSIQSIVDLDVVAGFPDILAEDAGQKAEDKNSIASLATTAAYSGYASIILDAPASSSIASSAVMAANTWVLVARPTLADAWASVDALRTVTQRAAGQHRIAPGNIFVVLNQRTNGMLSPDEWHKAADTVCRNTGLQTGFPPVAAVIPFVQGIPLSQDAGRAVLDSNDEFARPIHNLADMLFGGSSPADGKAKGKKFSFAGLSVKVKD